MLKAILLACLVFTLSACGSPDQPSISLYLAVQRADLDQLERHIYWKTDINTAFSEGQAPIHYAAKKGSITMLKLLLKHGAKVNQLTSNRQSALALALLNGRIQAAEILITASADFNPTELLLMAAQHNSHDRDVVRFLVAQGADLEATDDRGNTPLITSIIGVNHRLVSHLVEQGAFVNARNSEGKSALAIAENIDAQDIAQILIRNGAQSSKGGDSAR